MSTSTSLWSRLYNGETDFAFVERWKRWATLSGSILVVGLLSLIVQSLNFGIDFEGGTSWEVRASGVSVAETREALEPFGLDDAKVQVLGRDLLRVQAARQEGDQSVKVTAVLADLAGTTTEAVSLNDVGPSWGADVTRKAIKALVVFFVLIAGYISWRFEPKMALAALAAVVHDIGITIGVYSLSRFEVTPATVVAFLTILGFSLYDTIVVFDKVDENTKGLAASGKITYSAMVDLSMNQVLMRSLNTSLVATLPIASVLVVGVGILGATVLKDFGLALLVGLLTGAYSSIFIAAPVLALLKEREPRYAGIRQRLATKAAGLITPAATTTVVAGGTEAESNDDEALAPVSKAAPTKAGKVAAAPRAAAPVNRPPPRPRKKGKRR